MDFAQGSNVLGDPFLARAAFDGLQITFFLLHEVFSGSLPDDLHPLCTLCKSLPTAIS
jgi:hypothetical protein